MLMRATTVVQQLCKSCRSCFKFYCMFYFTCDRSLSYSLIDLITAADAVLGSYIRRCSYHLALASHLLCYEVTWRLFHHVMMVHDMIIHLYYLEVITRLF